MAADESGAHEAVKRGVLLVCHSEVTLSALAAILKQAGETALTVQSTADALACVQANAVSVVVLDTTSLGAEALALFRAIRSTRAHHRIPFVFLTDEPLNVEDYGGDGTHDAFLALPCPGEQFLATMNSLMHQPAARSTAMLQAVAESHLQIKTPAEAYFDSSESVFAGRLDLFDVTRVLSIIEPLKLTGILKVSDSKHNGTIHFEKGAVRHAELNDITGPDALFLLFHLKKGSFRFDLDPPSQERTIEGNTTALLLEGLRQMDEAKALIKELQQRRQERAQQQS